VLDGRPSRDPEMATGIPGGPRGRRKQAKPQRKGRTCAPVAVAAAALSDGSRGLIVLIGPSRNMCSRGAPSLTRGWGCFVYVFGCHMEVSAPSRRATFASFRPLSIFYLCVFNNFFTTRDNFNLHQFIQSC
jgi:hypothetical protein